MNFTIRQMPVLHLSYGNVLLHEIGARGPVTVEALLRAVDPETLFKSSHPHRDPAGRMKAILRFAEEVGLVAIDESDVTLTPVGYEYLAAEDPEDRFGISEAQAQVLRVQVMRRQHQSGMLRGAVLALSLLATATTEVAPEDLGRAIATIAGKTEWRSPRTFASQGERFAAFLEDARLIDADGEPTDVGRRLLTQLEAPPHQAIGEILDGNGDHQPLVGAAPDTVHLVLKWSAKLGERTIELHRQVADAHGEVWWRVHGAQNARGMNAQRVQRFATQLDRGRRTYVYLYGPTCWRTEMVAIRTSPPPSSERQLVPDYYDLSENGILWVKLRDFEPVAKTWMEGELALDGDRSKSIGKRGDRRFATIVHRSDLAEDRPTHDERRSVWWVNQGINYATERDGGYLWAADLAKDGRPRSHWSRLLEARPGDRVLHYATGQIRAVGTVTGTAIAAARPGAQPGEDAAGQLLPVDYRELAEAVPLSEVPIAWRLDHGPPFDLNGVPQQGYFFEVSPALAASLSERLPQLAPAGSLDGEPTPAYEEPGFEAILTAVRGEGMEIGERMLRRYHLALRTRGFVILSGVSGTGKTWLTRLYADAVGAEYELVAVAPNWTTNEELLGYLNPFDGKYRDTAFSLFLRAAASEYERASAQGREPRPFHLVLDEMNLARVEYYFAKFLSAMEIRARSTTTPIELAPGSGVLLSPNLRFIGTVNVDETTHGFADKVYDRAQLLEVELSRDGIERQLDGRDYGDVVLAVWDAVAAVAPFAYRTLDEIASYVEESGALEIPIEEALDEQILHKVLPKLSGIDPRVGDALLALRDITEQAYPLSHAKVERMLASVDRHGFASYF